MVQLNAKRASDSANILGMALYGFDFSNTQWRPIKGTAGDGGGDVNLVVTASGATATLQQDITDGDFPLFVELRFSATTIDPRIMTSANLLSSVTQIATLSTLTQIGSLSTQASLSAVTSINLLSTVTQIASLSTVGALSAVTSINTLSSVTQIASLSTMTALSAVTSINTLSTVTQITSTVNADLVRPVARTPLFAAIAVSASGANQIVGPDVANKIKAMGVLLVANAGAQTAQWQAGGTSITGPVALTTDTGYVLPIAAQLHWFETPINTTLVLNLAAALTVTGALVYIKESV